MKGNGERELLESETRKGWRKEKGRYLVGEGKKWMRNWNVLDREIECWLGE